MKSVASLANDDAEHGLLGVASRLVDDEGSEVVGTVPVDSPFDRTEESPDATARAVCVPAWITISLNEGSDDDEDGEDANSAARWESELDGEDASSPTAKVWVGTVLRAFRTVFFATFVFAILVVFAFDDAPREEHPLIDEIERSPPSSDLWK